jgi:hypothetical protein
MSPTTRLFGSDREEIVDLDTWHIHAPPGKGDVRWRDGYSAKEQAKAWTRSGGVEVPDELWSALRPLVDGDADELYGRPEHQTRLDKFSRARQHDMFACVRYNGETKLAVGIEAKACEDFDGVVADRALAAPPSKKRARCNLLSRALFGRPVINEETGELLDESLGRHGYQLWTAAVGTVIEAQRRGVDRVAVVVHQFRPRDPDAAEAAGDKRDWAKARARNADAATAFVAELQAAGSRTHATDFVAPGTAIRVTTVESLFDM